MASLRFPNPVSDIRKFCDTYHYLYSDLGEETDFNLYDIRDVLIENKLMTSSGAVGEKAKKRSYNKDKSRDPLYNQSKMYSELFRMLGWIHPGKRKLNFHTTELGSYINRDRMSWEDIKPLVNECILHIVFPNPYVENKGIKAQRPFPNILKLIKEVDGFLFRDELIITVLTLEDDKKTDNYIKKYKKDILNLRKTEDHKSLRKKLKEVTKKENVKINTLQNYTRFPLGVLRSSGWCTTNRKSTYGKSLQAYSITKEGVKKVDELYDKVDIRFEDIRYNSRNKLKIDEYKEDFTEENILNFILLSHYNLLEQSDFSIENIMNSIKEMEEKCNDIINYFNIKNRSQIFFSPFQQTPKSIIKKANNYEKNNYMDD